MSRNQIWGGELCSVGVCVWYQIGESCSVGGRVCVWNYVLCVCVCVCVAFLQFFFFKSCSLGSICWNNTCAHSRIRLVNMYTILST